MLTLNLAYDVLPNRQVTIQLPTIVQPGHHEMVIVLDKVNDEDVAPVTNISRVMQFAGAVSSFKTIDGLAYQNQVRADWK